MIKNVSYLILALISSFLISACAMEWKKHINVEGEAAFKLHATRPSTLPRNGIIPITQRDLQAGDILFSAEPSLTSMSIRLFNNASISHAFIYLGEGQIAEAVGSGVNIQSLEKSLKSTNLTAAFRRPNLTNEDVQKIRHFAKEQEGNKYNFVGIAKQMPYSITRQACDLPVIPQKIRRFCMNSMATIQITHFSSNRFFCSQFVVEAFNRAGKPLTDTEPEWISPSDILHMREDDVASVMPVTRLSYVGHLQCNKSLWNMSCN